MQFFKTLAMERDDLKLIGVLVLHLASRFASVGSWERLGVVSGHALGLIVLFCVVEPPHRDRGSKLED